MFWVESLRDGAYEPGPGVVLVNFISRLLLPITARGELATWTGLYAPGPGPGVRIGFEVCLLGDME